MRALSIDMYGTRDLDGLRKIMLEHDTELVGFSFDSSDHQANVDQAKAFADAIEAADLILSTGNYFWLEFYQNIAGIFDLLLSKIDNGTPFLFEEVRAWPRFYGRGANEPYSRKLFEHIGVRPTPLKVVSADSEFHDSSPRFRTSEGCFINGEIFSGIDKIHVNGAGILAFDPGDAFPVLETGILHTLINVETDLFDQLEVGLRPATIVEARKGNHNGLVISGNLIRDGHDVWAGHMPGVEQNFEVAQRVIAKLLRLANESGRTLTAVYQDLYDFERGLTDILLVRCQQNAALLRNANLTQILQFAVDNWPKIEDLLDYENAGEFSKAVSFIPAGVRNFMSHPVRSAFETISEANIAKLTEVTDKIRAARRKSRHEGCQ